MGDGSTQRASAREGSGKESRFGGWHFVGGVAGVQELQELQNKKIGIVPRMLIF
ncbi:MAG: hypothetical protein QOI53_3626 [Verrucomicrobiota bacterium]|jgi:hypothetical protein|nr:hypothetical protein [Verrucomicrobiota bacterium]